MYGGFALLDVPLFDLLASSGAPTVTIPGAPNGTISLEDVKGTLA